MKQSTVLIRVLSILFFPLLLIVGTTFLEQTLFNRQVLSSFDNVYWVEDTGLIRIEFTPNLINNTVKVQAKAHPEPSANIFYLEYIYQNSVVARYKVSVRSEKESMNIQLDTSQMGDRTVGVVSYESSGNIGFVFEKLINDTTIRPEIAVSVVPSRTQKWMILTTHLALIAIVVLLNVVHGIRLYKSHIYKAIQSFSVWDRIKYLLIGMVVPFGGTLLYIIGGTDPYNDYRVRMGNYSAIGFFITFVFYTIVRIFPLF
jgi:hypothetical protein